MVRESKSPHSSPTFCVRKPNGKWRMVHAFNKLNAATIPASTPIPRKDVLQNNMAGCTVFSALDMVDGYYQLLMRESDIPLTAVSTPSGMLWEWLVIAPGAVQRTRHVQQGSLRSSSGRCGSSYRRTSTTSSCTVVRPKGRRPSKPILATSVRFSCACARIASTRTSTSVSSEPKKSPFWAASLGRTVSVADPEKVCAIAQWPVPVSQKDLRKWLGLANYLHKYSANYAEMGKATNGSSQEGCRVVMDL
ncbi:hypothetical protein PF003_g9507 [Phytophthora fragariae]|nr:hypothetical protein PF003_g9507 [Phytophthora fragariae]